MGDLLDLLYYGDPDQAEALKDSIRESYTAIRAAILDLVKGERVVSLGFRDINSA